ncbi:hypothetical protein GALL_536460 [mine drainage metagenome]|uniref:Uncharacterized protein n=1 Tax=mine drainage metagenome TaxID=410659 RepID=A0A1J5P166_9ZZZZ
MVVRLVDHPRLDELFVAEDLGLQPGARLGEGLGDSHRLPILAMQLTPDDVLHFAIAQGFRLPEQQRELGRQLCAAFDQAFDSVDQVFQVEKGLSRAEHPRIDVRRESMFVDARDVLSDERRMRQVVIDARHTQQDQGDWPVLVTQQGFAPHL